MVRRNHNPLNHLTRRNKIATFIRHQPCPKCGSRDNLGVYSDGSCYCFGCGYSKRGTSNPLVEARDKVQPTEKCDIPNRICLPRDSTTSFPPIIVNWLGKCSLTVQDALRINCKWSPYFEQFIFPYYDERGTLVCVQARNFNPERAAKAKYFNQGSTKEILPIIKVKQNDSSNQPQLLGNSIVLTEDALSSLKIAHQSDAMPLLGTNLPVNKIIALKGLYQRAVVWLDSDKWREARAIAEKCSLAGLSTTTIFTELDPKYYSDLEIRNFLDKSH